LMLGMLVMIKLSHFVFFSSLNKLFYHFIIIFCIIGQICVMRRFQQKNNISTKKKQIEIYIKGEGDRKKRKRRKRREERVLAFVRKDRNSKQMVGNRGGNK